MSSAIAPISCVGRRYCTATVALFWTMDMLVTCRTGFYQQGLSSAAPKNGFLKHTAPSNSLVTAQASWCWKLNLELFRVEHVWVASSWPCLVLDVLVRLSPSKIFKKYARTTLFPDFLIVPWHMFGMMKWPFVCRGHDCCKGVMVASSDVWARHSISSIKNQASQVAIDWLTVFINVIFPEEQAPPASVVVMVMRSVFFW